jgi:plasmid stabilization system protein ParE
MSLPVIISERAIQDIETDYDWWAEHRSAEQAQRWRKACISAIDSLPLRSKRCPRAAEGNVFPVNVRQLNFGVGSKRTHRVLFTVRPDMIFVLRIQHQAQRPLTADDI